MKVIAACILIASLLFSTGCTTEETIAGDNVSCIGFDDNEDPRYEYEVDTLNVIGAVVFFELIIPPIYVAFEAVKCPTSLRATVDTPQ